MALVSMFLCNQSYASHGRDFLLGATILNFNVCFALCCVAIALMASEIQSFFEEGRDTPKPQMPSIARYYDYCNTKNLLRTCWLLALVLQLSRSALYGCLCTWPGAIYDLLLSRSREIPMT